MFIALALLLATNPLFVLASLCGDPINFISQPNSTDHIPLPTGYDDGSRHQCDNQTFSNPTMGQEAAIGIVVSAAILMSLLMLVFWCWRRTARQPFKEAQLEASLTTECRSQRPPALLPTPVLPAQAHLAIPSASQTSSFSLVPPHSHPHLPIQFHTVPLLFPFSIPFDTPTPPASQTRILSPAQIR